MKYKCYGIRSVWLSTQIGCWDRLLNSSINTLPCKSNLRQWGKTSNDKCWCSRKQTLNHILNGCRKALDQGRYTWRHDGILNYIANCLDKKNFECYLDIDGHQHSGGTLPPEIVVSTLKPDIVIVDKKNKDIHIFELTVPGESRIHEAHRIKTEKYQHFQSDILSVGRMWIGSIFFTNSAQRA